MAKEYNETKVSVATKRRIERVKAIQALLAADYTQLEIAEMWGVSRQNIGQLIHRERVSARGKVNKALQAGKVTKPVLCEHCRLVEPSSAHHDAYTKPLEVVWLCEPCHVKVDNKGWSGKTHRTHRDNRHYLANKQIV